MEPTNLSRSGGKCLNGLTLIPWSAGKSIIWDVTVVGTLAASYIQTMFETAGGAAEFAFTRKEDKYTALSVNYDLSVIAIETLGLLSTKTSTFLRELGRLFTIANEDPRATAFLIISTNIRCRFKVTRIRDSFQVQVNIDKVFLTRPTIFLLSQFFNTKNIIIITLITMCFLKLKYSFVMISSYLLSS